MRPSLPALARILPAAARTLSNRPDSPFSSAQAPTASRLTVDAPIRVFHWLFALSLVGAYLTGDSKWWRSSHIAFGYMMIALVAFRLVYGLVGPRHVRLSALLRRASGWSEWLQALKPGRRTLGRPAPQLQHLFTASVVLVLMMWIVPVFVTGYAALNEWDKPLGGDILETLHEFFANGFLLVIALHLAGLLLFSLVRRRNLAAPMLTGHAPGSGPAIVKRNRVWLGWLLAAGILAFGAWEWANAETVTGRTAGLGASQHTSMIWTLFSPLTIVP
jgi:cytochrome b